MRAVTPLALAAAVAAALPAPAAALPAAAPVASYVTTAGLQYVPGDVTLRRGSPLTLVSLGPMPHDLVSSDVENGLPLFQARIVAGPGDRAPVVGVESLGPGYHPFYCSLHESMRGTIEVV